MRDDALDGKKSYLYRNDFYRNRGRGFQLGSKNLDKFDMGARFCRSKSRPSARNKVRRLSQLGLLLTVLSIPVYKWAHPTLIPANGKPMDAAAIDQERAVEQEQKAVAKDAQRAREVYIKFGCGWEDLSLLTARYARRSQVPAQIVAAQVAVESSCRSYVVSPAGAVGLMQVNTRVWNYTRADMFDPDRNLNAGTQILAGYIRQSGNVRDGLRHYYGISEGSSASDEYADKVLQISARR